MTAIETSGKARFEAETKLKRKIIDALSDAGPDLQRTVLADVGRVYGFTVTFTHEAEK